VRFLATGWSRRRRHPRFNRVLPQPLVQALRHLDPKPLTVFYELRAPSWVANDTSSLDTLIPYISGKARRVSAPGPFCCAQCRHHRKSLFILGLVCLACISDSQSTVPLVNGLRDPNIGCAHGREAVGDGGTPTVESRVLIFFLYHIYWSQYQSHSLLRSST